MSLLGRAAADVNVRGGFWLRGLLLLDGLDRRCLVPRYSQLHLNGESLQLTASDEDDFAAKVWHVCKVEFGVFHLYVVIFLVENVYNGVWTIRLLCSSQRWEE